MSLWSLTGQQRVFKRYHSKKVMRVLPTKRRRKPAGIDMERNYVTVTLSIVNEQMKSKKASRSRSHRPVEHKHRDNFAVVVTYLLFKIQVYFSADHAWQHECIDKKISSEFLPSSFSESWPVTLLFDLGLDRFKLNCRDMMIIVTITIITCRSVE